MSKIKCEICGSEEHAIVVHLKKAHPEVSPADYQALNGLPQGSLGVVATAARTDGADRVVQVTVTNDGPAPVLNAKLTLVDAAGERILPAFYSANYIALLPGETRRIEVRYPASVETAPALTVRAWNLPSRTVAVGG